MPGSAEGAGEAARESREGRGAEIEGGSGLHDGPSALARAAVSSRHVAGQVSAQFKFLRKIKYVNKNRRQEDSVTYRYT